MTIFAPYGDATTIDVTKTSQSVALPTMPSGTPAFALVARQSDLGSLYLKLGDNTVTVSESTGFKVTKKDLESAVYFAVSSAETHIAILCDGNPGKVTLTAGSINSGTTIIPNSVVQLDASGKLPALSVLNQILTDGTTINWDMTGGLFATVTLGGNRTMAAPSNLKIGSAILLVRQDAVGGRTLTWNAAFKWPGGVAPALSSAANATDVFSFIVDGTNLYGTYMHGLA
jgi:hypothetical protein